MAEKCGRSFLGRRWVERCGHRSEGATLAEAREAWDEEVTDLLRELNQSPVFLEASGPFAPAAVLFSGGWGYRIFGRGASSSQQHCGSMRTREEAVLEVVFAQVQEGCQRATLAEARARFAEVAPWVTPRAAAERWSELESWMRIACVSFAAER